MGATKASNRSCLRALVDFTEALNACRQLHLVYAPGIASVVTI